MIEPTRQLVNEFARAARLDGEVHGIEYGQIKDGLAAALAAALRDRVVVDPFDLLMVLDQRVQHSHRVPGRWDATGQPCAECAARDRLRTALGGTP